MASDGLWELFSDTEVVNMLARFKMDYDVEKRKLRGKAGDAKMAEEAVTDPDFDRKLSEFVREQFFIRIAEKKGVEPEDVKALAPEQRRLVYDDTTIIVVYFKE